MTKTSSSSPRGACQICARPIGIKTGVIAHHGYQRPQHQGYQTSSCEGAKHLPYELSCDAIDEAIQRRLHYIEHCTAKIPELMAAPPAELVRHDAYGRVRETAPRPEGFDPEAALKRSSYDTTPAGTYAMLFCGQLHRLRRAIVATGQDIEGLRARKAAWVAPSTALVEDELVEDQMNDPNWVGSRWHY
jgi:hypothetical protein